MLSIPDFNAAMSGYYRRMLVVIAATVVTLLACLGAVVLFGDDLRAFHQHFGDVAAGMLWGLWPLPALLVLFVGVWMLQRWMTRDPRLVCPHCGKLLVRWHALVVVTRNCAHCGRRVFAEPEDAAGAGR